MSVLQPQVALRSLACARRGLVARRGGVLDGAQEGLDCQSLVPTLFRFLFNEAEGLVIVFSNSCIARNSVRSIVIDTIVVVLPLEDAQVLTTAGEEMVGGKREAHVGDMR